MGDIDKGLYEAPKGMEELGEEEAALKLEEMMEKAAA